MGIKLTPLQKFWLGFVISCGILIFTLFKLSDILWPFLSAFLLAYLLHPFVLRLECHGIKKSTSIFSVFILFSLMLVVVGTFLISMIRVEIPVVQSKIPVYIEYLDKNTLPSIENRFHLKLKKGTQDYIRDFTERLLTLSPGMANSISDFASQLFSKTINALIFFIDVMLIPVVMIYFLFDLKRMNDWFPLLVPQIYQRTLKMHLQEINGIIRRFIGGQLLISSFLSVFYIAGLTLIGLDLSVILGFFSALVNIVPYIGVLSGAMLSILFAFFSYHDILHPLMVIGLYLSGHLADGYYLSPKIVGKKIGLHPLIVILSLFIGGKIFGVIGLIFSVPTAAILNYIAKVGFEYYRKTEFYSGKPS
jgi:predicted PurR-regulated permease PerM